MINHYSDEQFQACLQFSDMLILNDVEWLKVEHRFGLTYSDLFNGFNVSYIIKTLGAKGSLVINKEGEINKSEKNSQRTV